MWWSRRHISESMDSSSDVDSYSEQSWPSSWMSDESVSLNDSMSRHAESGGATDKPAEKNTDSPANKNQVRKDNLLDHPLKDKKPLTKEDLVDELTDSYSRNLKSVESLAMETVQTRTTPMLYSLDFVNDKEKGRCFRTLKAVERLGSTTDTPLEDRCLVLMVLTDYISCELDRLGLTSCDPKTHILKTGNFTPFNFMQHLQNTWFCAVRDARDYELDVPKLKAVLSCLERCLPAFSQINLASNLEWTLNFGKEVVQCFEKQEKQQSANATVKTSSSDAETPFATSSAGVESTTGTAKGEELSITESNSSDLDDLSCSSYSSNSLGSILPDLDLFDPEEAQCVPSPSKKLKLSGPEDNKPSIPYFSRRSPLVSPRRKSTLKKSVKITDENCHTSAQKGAASINSTRNVLSKKCISSLPEPKNVLREKSCCAQEQVNNTSSPSQIAAKKLDAFQVLMQSGKNNTSSPSQIPAKKLDAFQVLMQSGKKVFKKSSA